MKPRELVIRDRVSCTRSDLHGTTLTVCIRHLQWYVQADAWERTSHWLSRGPSALPTIYYANGNVILLEPGPCFQTYTAENIQFWTCFPTFRKDIESTLCIGDIPLLLLIPQIVLNIGSQYSPLKESMTARPKQAIKGISLLRDTAGLSCACSLASSINTPLKGRLSGWGLWREIAGTWLPLRRHHLWGNSPGGAP